MPYTVGGLVKMKTTKPACFKAALEKQVEWHEHKIKAKDADLGYAREEVWQEEFVEFSLDEAAAFRSKDVVKDMCNGISAEDLKMDVVKVKHRCGTAAP